MRKVRVALGEGLFSLNAGFVRRAYKKDLENMGLEVISHSWTKKGIEADIRIVHSFAGGAAILNDEPTQLLITLDARRWCFWLNDDFKKPENTKHHYNFYQKGAFPGYFIDGANNVVYPKGHTSLPARVKKEVIKIVASWLYER